MPFFSRMMPALICVIAMVSACGDNGDGTGPNQGSLVLTDVDVDDDGLIEIATLEQLDWVRNDLAGTSLTDHDGGVNSRGCPPAGCKGYELIADLDFDTNGDGVLDPDDDFYDYDGDGRNAGWLPIGGVSTLEGDGDAFVASFEGNNHRVSNLFINRPFASGIGLIGIIESTPDAPVAIRNVVIDGSLTSVRGYNVVGLLAGLLRAGGPMAIENNKVAGQVATLGVDSGGMIGQIRLSDGELVVQGNDSSASVRAEGTIAIAAGSLIGEILGTVGGRGSARLSANSASGQVTNETGTGGLIGQIESEDVPVLMEDCSSSSEVTGASFYAGGLVGLVSGSSIRISRAQASGSVRAPIGFGVGGLIGQLRSSGDITLEESMSSTAVSTAGGPVGGLIGVLFLNSGRVAIHSIFSEGAVEAQDDDGGPVGGLIGLIAGGPGGQLSLSSGYSAGDVSGTEKAGGLVGEIDVEGNAAVVMENFFALGRVSADVLAGGLIGRTRARDTATVNISNGYVVNAVTANRDAGAVGGFAEADPAGTVTFRSIYWAVDTTTQMNGFGGITPPASTQGLHGSTLAGLSCPTGPNDVSCDGNELYHGWGEALNAQSEPAWRFSNSGALPALRFGGVVHQPTYSGMSFSVVRE